jgi:hypothetical protein
MLIYELTAVIAAVMSALAIGGFCGILGHLLDAKKQLKDARYESVKQMQEFDEIVKRSSDSNISLGNMLTDLENRITIIDERVSLLGGTLPTPGAGETWSERAKRNPPG